MAGWRIHRVLCFEHWDRLLFRDYLLQHPDVAGEYERLKMRLATEYPKDRVAYTKGKTNFILRMTVKAKKSFHKP